MIKRAPSTLKAAALAGAATSCLFWQSALADTAQATDATQSLASPVTALQEIIVTSRHREEDVQKVPITVSVVTAVDLAQHQVTDFYSLQELTPSLTVTSSVLSPSSNFSIRGVGTAINGVTVDQSVGLTVDDVSMGLPTLYYLEPYDMQRVEVLDGPQGMLFGKNASAGMINIVTNDPVIGKAEFTAHGEYGSLDTASNGNRYRLDAAGDVPIGDTLALRLMGFWLHDPAVVNNVNPATQDSFLGQERYGLRAKVLWEPTSRLRVLLSGDYTNVVGPFPGGQTTIRRSPDGGLLQLVDAAIGITGSPTNTSVYEALNITKSRNEIFGTSLKISYDLGGGYTLTNIASYRHQDGTGLASGGGWLPADAEGVNPNQPLPAPGHQDQTTEELRFTSPADQRLTYQGGFFYQQFDSVTPPTFATSDIYALLPGSLFNGLLATGTPTSVVLCSPGSPPYTFPAATCVLNPLIAGLFGATALSDAASYTDMNSRSYAAYLEGTFKITNALNVTLGGRYTNDFKSAQEGALIAPNNILAFYPAQAHSQTVTAQNFSWRGSVNYFVTPDIMTYFTYGRGYKGPGIDANGADESAVAGNPIGSAGNPGLRTLAPEISNNYELGLKTTLFDNRLRFDLSLYQENFSNFQTSNIVCQPTQGGGCTITIAVANAGQLETRGVEAQFTAVPIQGLTLSGGVSFMGTQYEGLTGQCYPGQRVVVDTFNKSVCTIFSSGNLAPANPGAATLAGLAAAHVIPAATYADYVQYLASTPTAWSLGYTDESGDPLQQAPPWSLNFSAHYDHPVWNGWSGFVQADLSYKSAYEFFPNANPLTNEPAFTIVNMSVGAHSNDGRLAVTLFVKNLTDQRVPTFVYQATLGTLLGDIYKNIFDMEQSFSTQSYRQIGVTLDYRM